MSGILPLEEKQESGWMTYGYHLGRIKPKAFNHREGMSHVAHGFYHTSENKLATYMWSSRKDMRRGSLSSGWRICEM